MTDPALDFWLRHVAAEGGLFDPAGETTYVVLPPALSDHYRLPEELHVTSDPDVGRDEGVTLLALGHPVLSDAAERTLAAGDAGSLLLARPASAPPSPDVLLEAARDTFPVDHGRIDARGEPQVVRHGVIRVGALVTFELSAEDRFQEQAERWVDVPSRRLLPAPVVGRLTRAAVAAAAGSGDAAADGDLLAAIAEAHRLIDAAALARRAELAAEASTAYHAERARAAAYYADAIAGIEKRLATAPAERRAVLEQRLRSTREEEARRLAEIAEKYAASHAIRPYRLHVIGVPALRLAADVRRGDRRYPMTFDWLLPAGAFAPVRCPSCGGEAPLVAGKQKLGCETCLPPRAEAPPAKPTPPARPTPSVKPAPPTRPVPSAHPAPAPAGKPTGSGKPAAPPHVRRENARRERRAPGKIAEDFWNAVVVGNPGEMAAVLAPRSPAAVLYAVFGQPGLTQVIGMDPHVRPYSYTAGEWQFGTSAPLISGTLTGEDDSRAEYFLSHRDGMVLEVLPWPIYADGELWKPYWLHHPKEENYRVSRLPLIADLDAVGQELLNRGRAWNGLPVAARSVAAWERITDHHQRVLTGRAPRAAAAAVDRLVAYRAGGRSTFGDASAVYQVDEQAIRQADRAIRPLLALGPDRPW